MFQQLTGNNYFFYYGTIVFKSVGLKDSFQTSIVIGVVNFASTFFSLWTVENLGRRKCLLLGAATMMACMVIYASVGVTRLYPHGKRPAIF
ncbi:AEL_collapsed_G0036950.mRNA.1.CDS.1 [Saccharomyces cerevisiae]|nr:AEL_collapsed_G0036950.mRNA.1.CDS.1 [Saccharomyces cerevisiae]